MAVERRSHGKVALADSIGRCRQLHDGDAQAAVGEDAQANSRDGRPDQPGDRVRRSLAVLRGPVDEQEQEGDGRHQAQQRNLIADGGTGQRLERFLKEPSYPVERAGQTVS